MPAYKDRKKLVAYRNGVAQVAYRNGEQVVESPLIGSYVITPAFNSTGGLYGLSQQIIGDIEPNRFLGYVWTSLYSRPSDDLGLQVTLNDWSRAYQNGYRQTFIVTRLDTYYTAEAFSESAFLSGFEFTTIDRSLDMFDVNDLAVEIPLHIALRCEFDLTLNNVIDGGTFEQSYLYDDSNGSITPEWINGTFKVVEVRTNVSTDTTTVIFSIRQSNLTPVELDATWKLYVWQYDTNDNLLGKARLNWSDFTSNNNVFTLDESVFQLGVGKFVFQIGRYT